MTARWKLNVERWTLNIRQNGRRLAYRAGVALLAAYLMLLALTAGLQLRPWVWEATKPIRFVGDINRGCSWGLLASGPEGYLNQYEKMAGQQPAWTNWLDYAPLRLAVMRGWGAWLRNLYPALQTFDGATQQTPWQPDYEFSRPVLWFNTGMELLAMICVFILTRLWVIRAKTGKAITPSPGLRRAQSSRTPDFGELSRAGEGRGEGDFELRNPLDKPNHPHPLPEYAFDKLRAGRERGPEKSSLLSCGFLLIALIAIAYHATTFRHGFQLALTTQSIQSLYWPLWLVPAAAFLLATPSGFLGCGSAFIAALLLWFNPAILLSAHGWPTWDMWIVPMFLLAVLLASYGWWFTAGLVVAVGAMLKGQQLTVAPMFLIWALFLGQPSAAFCWICGLIFGFGVIASPWLITYLDPAQLDAARHVQFIAPQPWELKSSVFNIPRLFDRAAMFWVISVGLLCAAAPFVLRMTLSRRTWTPRSQLALRASTGALIFVAIVWPWMQTANRQHMLLGIVIAFTLSVTTLLLRPNLRRPFACGIVGAALLFCISLFHGSTAWWDCGFRFGTIHWPWMVMGMTSNLPSILSHQYGWPMNDLTWTVFTLPKMFGHDPVDVTAKSFLTALYVICLLVCSVGVGIHARRRDPRVLVGFVGVWVMFFCFPPQIHERYLLFAAGAAAMLTGVSVGMTLIGLFLSAVTCIMTLHVMLRAGDANALGQKLSQQFPQTIAPDFGMKLLRLVEGTYPEIGWAVLLCGGIFLYYAIAPTRRPPVSKVISEVSLPK